MVVERKNSLKQRFSWSAPPPLERAALQTDIKKEYTIKTLNQQLELHSLKKPLDFLMAQS